MAEETCFDFPEGSVLLPRGWGAKSQCLIYQDGGDGRIVVSFGPNEESFDETLAQAAQALAEFTLLDRRRIQLEQGLGDYAEIAFVLNARPVQQILVRVALGETRCVTFQASVQSAMTAAARQDYLAMICSFQARVTEAAG